MALSRENTLTCGFGVQPFCESFALPAEKILPLTALAQADESQVMPGHLETKAPANQLFDFFYPAVLKIFRLPAFPTN